jgi:hypothetical protein
MYIFTEALILGRAAAKKILMFRKNPEIPEFDNILKKSKKSWSLKNLKNPHFFSATGVAEYENFSQNTKKIWKFH